MRSGPASYRFSYLSTFQLMNLLLICLLILYLLKLSTLIQLFTLPLQLTFSQLKILILLRDNQLTHKSGLDKKLSYKIYSITGKHQYFIQQGLVSSSSKQIILPLCLTHLFLA